MDGHPNGAGKSSFDLVETDALFRELDLKENTVFLDLGCGAGRYALAAARFIGEKGRIHAVDLWEAGVETLKEKAAKEGLGYLTCKIADVGEHIPIADAAVDLCLLATVFHDLVHAGVHEGALREIQRVMKPGGRIAVVEFVKKEGPPGPPAAIRLSPGELEATLSPRGFVKRTVCNLGEATYLMMLSCPSTPQKKI